MQRRLLRSPVVIRRLPSFAFVDVLATVTAIALLAAIGIPTAARVRELSKRNVCAVNLAGIGAAANAYAADNRGQWMVPAFRRALIDNGGIDYLPDKTSVDAYIDGEVGCEREFESHSDTPMRPGDGTTSLSVTRAYWMLIRSGDVRPKQFICPSNLNDSPDPTEQTDHYYDFTRYGNISYGYQVPFGPPDTQPRQGADPRQVLAADKGPWYFKNYRPPLNAPGEDGPVTLEDPPKNWRLLNSTNHGGQANGEGQNSLYADGHASFVRIPASGIDGDNIYTVIEDNAWNNPLGLNRIHGITVWEHSEHGPYPGQDAFGVGPGRHSSTDSLIFP